MKVKDALGAYLGLALAAFVQALFETDVIDC